MFTFTTKLSNASLYGLGEYSTQEDIIVDVIFILHEQKTSAMTFTHIQC